MNTSIWHRDVPVYLSFIAIICYNFLCTELCYLLIAERITTPSFAGLLVSDDTMLTLRHPLTSGNQSCKDLHPSLHFCCKESILALPEGRVELDQNQNPIHLL